MNNGDSEQNDSSNEDTETDSENEDDEIDVVGNSDLGGSSARTRHCNLAAIGRSKSKHHVNKQQNNEQSRSLLKKQVNKPAQTMIKTSILDDHCHFLARPQKDIKPLKGMLTPNESSEDEDLFESQTASNFNTATTTTSNVNNG